MLNAYVCIMYYVLCIMCTVYVYVYAYVYVDVHVYVVLLFCYTQILYSSTHLHRSDSWHLQHVINLQRDTYRVSIVTSWCMMIGCAPNSKSQHPESCATDGLSWLLRGEEKQGQWACGLIPPRISVQRNPIISPTCPWLILLISIHFWYNWVF